MDSDPRALSDMFTTPAIQTPLAAQSYLMDNDSNANGRPRGSRPKSNGRTRSVTNPEPLTPQSPSVDGASSSSSSTPITRVISSPTPTTPTTTKAPSKPRRGLFSLLASAAQPPPTPPKTAENAKESNASTDSTSSPQATPPATPPPTFMQSLARRLSGSSGKKQVTENKHPAPQCPRRTLNVNHVRPRPQIKELEKIQLKRVCFVADETLVSRRLFKASEPFETELPREQKLKVRDLRDAYYRAARNREVAPDDRVAKAFALAKGVELRKLDLSMIKFASRDNVLPVCDVLSLARGLEEVVLDHCELTAEQLRLFLAALLCLKQGSEKENEHNRGVAKLSIAGNSGIGLEGWRTLACHVHMNPNLHSLNISHIPISLEAATILSRAIALPNPSRREIPPEFRLLPISPRAKQSRKLSFRRGSSSSFGSDLTRTISPTMKRQLAVTEEVDLIEEVPNPEEPKNQEEPKKPEEPKNPELPDIPPHRPISTSFDTPVSENPYAVMDPPSEATPSTPKTETRPSSPRRKVEELRMNDCGISAEILELFVYAVTNGGVRYWAVGGNKFDVKGMKMIAGLFADSKPEPEPEVDGRATPTPVPSIASVPTSTTSGTPEEAPPTWTPGKLEFLSFEGSDLSNHQLDPLLEVWINHPNPSNLSLWALDLGYCRLGQDISFFSELFKALRRFPNLRLLHMAGNPLFANPSMIKALREGLPGLPILRRLDISGTGMEAQHLVELARILPEVKLIAALSITENPIYEIHNVEEEQEGQTEDVSGLTALEAATRYCKQLIEVELPEGGGVEAARLRHRIFLRCFKNIEALDHAAHPHATDDPSEPAISGRKRTNTEEANELARQSSRESRDKYEVDRGHGVARALETVLLNVKGENKAQDMSLDLLYRARRIKERLQPALIDPNQDVLTHRRLLFLNHVLTKVIDRFEEAFPECRNNALKSTAEYQPESSDEEPDEEEKQPSPTRLRRSSSMTELARGLELEEGDVHRFGNFVMKRNLAGPESDLSGDQLLEAILKVDKETVEREVWDKDGLRRILQDARSAPQQSDGQSMVSPPDKPEEGTASVALKEKEKKDTDSHSI